MENTGMIMEVKMNQDS